ncbi:MAG: hypothetical protein GX868_03895, partial [Actinobacteria bacterium]|nr:hypothetical protein [Actinomycetota bacterium]
MIDAPSAAAPTSSASSRLADWWESYWYEAVDMTRLRYFTRIVFAALLYTIWKVDYWGPTHAWAPREMYQPIAIARLLHIGPPTETSMPLLQAVLTASLIAGILLARPTEAAWNRVAARVTNLVVFLAFGLWNIWSFSWSKVDHDRLVPTVAIAVLCVVPAVGVGPARNVGWALRSIQVILVLTYPLSAISKLQKSGWFWLNSAVFTRAIIRRGTEFGQFLMNHPTLLRVGQWSFFGFEVISVLALSRNASIRRFIVPGFFA